MSYSRIYNIYSTKCISLLVLLLVAFVSADDVSNRRPADGTVCTPGTQVHTARITHTHMATLVQHRVDAPVQTDTAVCVLYGDAEGRGSSCWKTSITNIYYFAKQKLFMKTVTKQISYGNLFGSGIALGLFFEVVNWSLKTQILNKFSIAAKQVYTEFPYSVQGVDLTLCWKSRRSSKRFEKV